VRDLEAHRHFYANIVGLPEQAYPLGAAFRAGDTVILSKQESGIVTDSGVHGLGWRYITFQVFKVDEVHARMIAAGAREASAPKTLGTTARISVLLDPDGNWIELSQRASIVGTLT
jgi:lactoylglutathione lyase